MYIKYNFRLIVIGYIFAIILFIISASVITLYSLGYRLNLDKFELEKTGIIRLNPISSDFSIDINNQPLDNKQIKTTTEIANLKPDSYQIHISAPDFIDWKKNISVLPNQITNIYDILLIPQKPKTEEITYFNEYVINHKYQLVAYTANDKLQIFNFVTQKTQTAANIKINNSSQINWINDELLAITNSNPEETIIQILNPFNNNISSHTIKQSINAKDIIGTIPFQESTLIYYYNESLYTVDITSNQEPQTIIEHVYFPDIKDGNLYYLPFATQSKQLFIQNLTLKNTSIIDLPSPADQFKIISNSNYIQLTSDQKNTIIDINNPTNYFQINNIDSLISSNNNKFLAGFNQQEIINIDLDKNNQTDTILRLSSHINSINWIDSTNIIYASTNQLSRIDYQGNNHNIIEEKENAEYQILFTNQQKILIIYNVSGQKLLKIISLI